jgi:hypothetical protein
MQATIHFGIRTAGFLTAGICAALLSASLAAQTVSPSAAAPGQPSLQPSSQPASSFNQQTGELGVAGFEDTATITPEGYLRTGFEELMFFSGQDLEPTSAGGPIAKQGGLPIAHYEIKRDGLAFRFTIFAGKIDRTAIVHAREQAKFPFMPGFDIQSGIIEPEVTFVRVDIVNKSQQPRRAVFAAGVRYGEHPAVSGHNQSGESFNPGWANYFDDANFYRFNRDLYNFPPDYADRSFTVRKNWNEPNPQYVLTVTRIVPPPTPATPIGIVTYTRPLGPGETWTLNFKLPVIPTADSFVISAIDGADAKTIEAQVHAQPPAEKPATQP